MYTLLTVMIVAIGLGLSLYSYSLLNHLVFKPLYLNSDQEIVAVEAPFDHNHLFRFPADPFHINSAAKQLDIFSEYGFYTEGTTILSDSEAKYRGLTNAKKVNSTYVSWNTFDIAGTKPLLGRGFEQGDIVEGAESVIVLSHKIWQQYFDGDSDVVGKTIELDASKGRVIGVMPQGFAFPEIAEVWQPLASQYTEGTAASYNRLFSFARLQPEISIEMAQSLLDGFNAELATTIEEDFRFRIQPNGDYLMVKPFKHASITQYYNVFIALFIVVFLILLLACINVSNLLLARVNERIKEVAIRVALGIPRNKLIIQMLWESVFICTIGGLLAILFAGYGVELTNQMFDATFAVNNQKPFWWAVSIDADGLAILLLAVVLMVLITGLLPAYKALNNDFNAVIRDGTRGAIGKKAAFKSKLLVTSQIVLSCVVLVMATTLLSTGYFAGNADYGVETQSRLTAQLQLSPEQYPIRRNTEFEREDALARAQAFYRIKAHLESTDTFMATALMSQLPGRGEGTSFFGIEGREAAVYNENPYSNNEGVVNGSWAALGMKVIQGRDFDHRDIEGDGFNVMINESIANDFFPDGDAVGTRIRRVGRNGASNNWMTIIGVVSDTFHGSTMRKSSASYNTYHLVDLTGTFRLHIAAHYSGNFEAAKAALVQEIGQVEPDVGVYHVQTYDNLIQQPVMLLLSVSKIFLFCGIVAAILAASGIYAMASNNIVQRTQEIGVRRAVGATDSTIMKMFFKQAAGQLLVGLSVGVVLALILIGYMSNTIIINPSSYGVALIGVPMMIITMVVLATYFPIKSILKLEPSDALHYD